MNIIGCISLKYQNNSNIKKSMFVLLILFINFFLFQQVYAQGSTFKEDAKKAVLKYAESQTREAIKAHSKAAITALYKRLYESGANRSLSKKSADVAQSTEEINQLAEAAVDAFSSNDPKKVQAAAETMAITLGNRMATFAKTPAGRRHLAYIMGKAGDIKEISGLLGASGTKHGNRAIAKYAGQALINLTPAASAVALYQSTYGAMKYANDQFVSSGVEDLYQIYKKDPKHGIENVNLLLYAGKGYGYIVRDRKKELRENNMEVIDDAAGNASPALIRHLTNATDDEVRIKILETFKKRHEKEKQDAIIKAKQKNFQEEAEAVLQTLSAVASNNVGKNWYEKHQWQLADFTDRVRKALLQDGVLDPHKISHIKAMSRAKAICLIYNRNSPECKAALEKIKKLRNDNLRHNLDGQCLGDAPRLAKSLKEKGYRLLKRGKPQLAFKYMRTSLKACHDSKFQKELSKLEKEYCDDKAGFLEKNGKTRKVKSKAWTQKKRKLIRKRLARLNHTKFLDTMKTLKLTLSDPFLDCLCRNAGYGSPGTRQFYHPGVIGEFDERYSCQQPGEPCVVAGYGCTRHPLPNKQSVWDMCMNANRLGMKKDKNGKVKKDEKGQPIPTGKRMDDFIMEKLQNRQENKE